MFFVFKYSDTDPPVWGQALRNEENNETRSRGEDQLPDPFRTKEQQIVVGGTDHVPYHRDYRCCMYQPDYRCWFLSAGIEFSNLGVVPFPGSSGK